MPILGKIRTLEWADKLVNVGLGDGVDTPQNVLTTIKHLQS